MKWQKINPYCIKSGPWMLAKHGGRPPKYLLTHDTKPGMLCWFGSSQEAMETAERLEAK